jgi:hypothetical protein
MANSLPESGAAKDESLKETDALLRAEARAFRPRAWAVLLLCVLAIVFAANTLLLPMAAGALRTLAAWGNTAFWSILAFVAAVGIWLPLGTLGLRAFRRWFRSALGPVWRRALRRTPFGVAVLFAFCAGVLTLIMGLAWSLEAPLAVFVALMWGVVVGASMRSLRV